ncbi:MAG: prepilin-type N-terminal cleavage/methylation domain-containing protein [Planctomycetia bacterium]|nr:prepilin-type N-terminal cleavage/methylation domain-containing protein [Planctomycetia bacterium]
MNKTANRNGFTLVEILIVVGIIVLVAAIFVPVILNLTDRNQVPKGASLLENALSIAKTKAVELKRPYGVRLLAAANNTRATASGSMMAWYNQLQFIENPPEYSERWVWTSVGESSTMFIPFWNTRFADPTSPPAGVDSINAPNLSVSLPTIPAAIRNQLQLTFGGGPAPPNPVYNYRRHVLFSPIVTSTGWFGNANINRFSAATNFQYNDGSPDLVFAGDYIELNGTGQIYKIIFVSTGTFLLPITPLPGNNAANARVHYLILDRPLPNEIVTPLNGQSNFRIVRSPRVVANIPTIDLPQDVVIDANPSFLVGGVKNPVDVSGNIFMSGVGNGNAVPSAIGSGITTSEITGLTTVTAAQAAPMFIDILFSPTGEVLPTSQTNGLVAPQGQNATFSVGASGLIALWVHQRGDPNLWAARQITAAQGNADNQALVAINTRTGFIGSYPINLTPGPSGVDPLYNARAGKVRISADTGP